MTLRFSPKQQRKEAQKLSCQTLVGRPRIFKTCYEWQTGIPCMNLSHTLGQSMQITRSRCRL